MVMMRHASQLAKILRNRAASGDGCVSRDRLTDEDESIDKRYRTIDRPVLAAYSTRSVATLSYSVPVPIYQFHPSNVHF